MFGEEFSHAVLLIPTVKTLAISSRGGEDVLKTHASSVASTTYKTGLCPAGPTRSWFGPSITGGALIADALAQPQAC